MGTFDLKQCCRINKIAILRENGTKYKIKYNQSNKRKSSHKSIKNHDKEKVLLNEKLSQSRKKGTFLEKENVLKEKKKLLTVLMKLEVSFT